MNPPGVVCRVWRTRRSRASNENDGWTIKHHQTLGYLLSSISFQSHFQQHIWIFIKFLGMRLKWSANLDISYEMRWTIFVDLDKADLINKSGSTQTAWRSLLRFLPAPGNFDCQATAFSASTWICWCTLPIIALLCTTHLFIFSPRREHIFDHICTNPQPNQLLDSNDSHRGL